MFANAPPYMLWRGELDAIGAESHGSTSDSGPDSKLRGTAATCVGVHCSPCVQLASWGLGDFLVEWK